MKIETAKCPNCGASLSARLSRDGERIKVHLVPEPPPAPPPPTIKRAVASASPSPAAKQTITPPPPPGPERAPFDEWLLSERNIKIALYSGALLLVLAGIIFIGSKWGEFGGPAKFALMLLATGLLYLGGYLLFRRPALRLGGVAVLSVASGFCPLNFAVLQIYVLGPAGFRDDVMWLIASPTCLVLYALTAYRARADLFTYLGVGALLSTLTAALSVVAAPLLAYPPAHLFLALALLWLAWRLQETQVAEFTRTPLLVTTHLAAPLHILAALLGFALGGAPWLALTGLYLGVLFYVAADALFGWWGIRWVAAGLFPLAFGLTLWHLGFDDTALGVALMLLALAYQGIGYGLERLQGQRRAGWPLYAVAYVLAWWVTSEAAGNPSILTLALLGDVAMLALSALIFGHVAWAYGAVWLFMLPAYLFLTQHVPTSHHRGLLMGVLGLYYLGAGYALSYREVGAGRLPRLGGPFLSAAAALSIVVLALAWTNPAVATALLVAVAIIYLSVALWLDGPLLLFPALAALNLGVFTIQEIFVGYGVIDLRALNIAYAALALVLPLVGLWLRRQKRGRWAVPLYVVAVLDLLGSFGVALFDRPLAIALSATYAALLLAFAWLERRAMRAAEQRDTPLLSYLGLLLIVIGHFYVLDAARPLSDWPPFSAGLCGLFVLLAWGLRRGELGAIYGTPLRRVGLGLTTLPMGGALVTLRAPVVIATFSVVGLTCGLDAIARRRRYQAYLSGVAFWVVYWALLGHLGIAEPQAYVVPPGLALLGLGWDERRRDGDLSYRLPTLLGLSALLASSFLQSLAPDGLVYVLWLTIESLAVIAWGMWSRSRGYVRLGMLALVVHALAQFGPAFVELPRWVQLALIGGVLLGGGIAFLTRRKELLQARWSFDKEWKRWQP